MFTVNNDRRCESNFVYLEITVKNSFFVFLLIFSILTALTLPLSALFPTAEDAELYQNIIRLHVVANSDSKADQSLKLKVRDRVLEYTSEILSEIKDKTKAETILSENICRLESIAAEALAQEGVSCEVDVTLSEESYPTREYGSFSLPAGNYTSLRVLIGEAKGKNWWCMLYPSLCVGAVTKVDSPVVIDEDEFIEAGLTSGQVKIITGNSADIKIKFRILELLQDIFS